MRLHQFRDKVFAEFGQDLGRATPANVVEFLAKLEQEEFGAANPGRLDLDEPTASYESIIKDFLARMLQLPESESVVPLWTFACQLAFAMVGEYEEGRLPRLDPPAGQP
ncbi:MAG: hypothetical protein HRF45_09510 [Fimbriimonadia bacterium]|jgi:hypothetical protein